MPEAIRWLEISLILDPELVEPASELLGRIAPSGVAIEPAGEQILLRAWLAQDDATGSRVEQFEHGLWHLGQITPFPQPSYTSVPDADWETAWKRGFRAIPIGGRLLVQPVAAVNGAGNQPIWNDGFEPIGDSAPLPADPNRIVLLLEPGMAFGTGTHPTTRHCLELLERRLHPGDRALDLGCGSGILSIAAALLGASSVQALDIDPQAVQLAQVNLSHNQLSGTVAVEQGSLAQVPEPARFELIMANIQARVIAGLLGDGLAGHLSPKGALIVSGILDEQLAEIDGAVRAADLWIDEVVGTADWRTLVLRPDSLQR